MHKKGIHPQPEASLTSYQTPTVPILHETAPRRGDPWGWLLLATIYASAMAWLAMAAIFFLARDTGGMEVVTAICVAALGLVPLIGHGAGSVAAMFAWDWNPAASALVFFGFVVLLLPLWCRLQFHRHLRTAMRDTLPDTMAAAEPQHRG